MIPVRLSLKGFLSYQKEVELDFTGFDLACISGANGAGKSTLLDAITWALFGRARKKEDDALINSSSNSAEVIFEFIYENDRYRIQRSKVRNKTSILEFQLLNPQNEWVSLSEHSLRETERRIEQILCMDYDTFINTCFFLQGKADQFAQQPAGKRKEILSSILNLEIWEEYRTAAALRRRREENETTAIHAWLEEIETELAQEGERRARLERTSRELELKSDLRKEKEKLVENTRRQADLLKEQEKLLSTHQEHLDELNRQKEENQSLLRLREDELKSYEQILKDEKSILDEYAYLTRLRRELERLDQQKSQFFDLEQQRLEQEKLVAMEKARLVQLEQYLLEQKERAGVQAEKIQLLQPQLASVEAELKLLEGGIDEKEKALASLQELQLSQADRMAENKQLRSSMAELKSQIDQLKAAGASCPLCGRELTDLHRASLLSGFEMEGKNQGDRYRQNEKLIQGFSEEIVEIQERIAWLEKSNEKKELAINKRAMLEAEIRSASTEIEKWEKSAAIQLIEVQEQLQKQQYALDAHNRLKEITTALQSQGYDSQAHEQIKQGELLARGSEDRHRALEKAHASTLPLKREKDAIEKRNAELEGRIQKQSELVKQTGEKLAQTASALPDLAQMETELNAVLNEENDLRLEAGRAEQEVAVLANRKQKKDEYLTKRNEKARLIAQLESLERAFGKNGVPALLIEQALPDIESKANEILDQLSAGSMSLSFATQRERKSKKDEGAIQTLDILITDSSGTREYELFSGGEAFRINFAIRLALSQALAKRVGARLQTLVIDEGFGSQDADGRQRLIEAINLVMQNGGQTGNDENPSDIRKILVITHLDELKDAFPARIEVEKSLNGSVLQVVN